MTGTINAKPSRTPDLCSFVLFFNSETASVARVYERGVRQVHRSGARRTKKGTAALAIDILFLFVFFYIFNSNPQFVEKLQPVPGAQSSLVPPCKTSLGGPVGSVMDRVLALGVVYCGS